MPKNLVIVESPAKAKTIEKYLGKDYIVRSSFGHIRDLPKKGLSVDKDKNFEPTYEVAVDKKRVVSDLKKAVKETDTVWLASDEDREGEAIAWHLCQALKLDISTTKRIVFHEITKTAIESAIKNPRTVDVHLVDAQQARRVLDRLVGYELSPVLWKKIQPGLSAGRVQSVAVRLIVEREREIQNFSATSTYKVTGNFTTDQSQELTSELSKPLETLQQAEELLTELKSKTFTVESLEQKEGTRSPSAPFTTSSLQQEASRKLGYSVKQTMTLAQRLYENGHITYMRTDSTTLSGLAISAIGKYIEKEFGKQYHQVRQYRTKQESAQEAHEAIRPTRVDVIRAGDDQQQQKLYELIWKRALASQMAPAKTDKTVATIGFGNSNYSFVATGEILTFDGFMKVYGGGKDDTILPKIDVGQKLNRQLIEARQNFNRPPARFSEASLVKALEDMGIGRPSTYAPTISTIQDRGYIEKQDLDGKEREITVISLDKDKLTTINTTEKYGADKNKLMPTHLADMTTDFLVKYFADIVDYDFTATVEKEFDLISEGKTPWNKMISEFYKDTFHPLVESSADVSRQETSQARILGVDPKSGKNVIARYGRFGPMLQIGETSDETEKPKFAPMPSGASINTVTFEQALEMFKLPRTVGKTEDGETILSNIGKFGPYIQVDKMYVSIKPLDPMTITEAEARELIAAKKEALKPLKDFGGGVVIKKGPYGAYLTDGSKNARIPKTLEINDITEEIAKELIAKAPQKGTKRRFGRKKSKN
jgi:DNA topoisomerase-1